VPLLQWEVLDRDRDPIMTPDEILDRAADLIDERGWCQGTYQDSAGGLCIDAATAVAAMGRLDILRAIKNSSFVDATLAVVEAVDATTFKWNDAPERTQEEVTSTMRAVAITLRARRIDEKLRELAVREGATV
jgi:hypothetical protein